MRFDPPISIARYFILPLLLIFWTSIPVAMQASESESGVASADDSQDAGRHPRGFRFHAPRFFLGVRAGMNFARAGSDLFSMVTRELTLEKSDFRSPTIGLEAGAPLGRRFAAVFGFEYGSTAPPSEFRNLVEDNGQAITQVTHFKQMPITATLRFYPIKQGEIIGNHVWIPTRVLPYVGGGGGAVWYEFSQSGDFVDTKNMNIFSDHLQSRGFTPSLHTVAGMDISLSPSWFLNVETRYSWAKKTLGGSFTGFQPIDLSGMRTSGGVYIRF